MNSLFAYGFRPHFLAAGLAAATLVAAWAGLLAGGIALEPRWSAVLWHGHELVYGFVGAAIAGFLLTAVPSWTGQRGYAGAPLVALAALWLAGRAAPFAPSAVPDVLVAATDVLFLPAVALLIAPPLFRERNRNRVLLLVLGALTIGNLGFHWAAAHGNAELATRWLHAAINLAVLLTAVIGGRIVPAFTASGLRPYGVVVAPSLPWLERAALGATALVVLVDFVAAGSTLAATVAACAGAAHLVRAARWSPHRTWRVPLAWVLHLGYAWIAIGLLLKATFLFTGAAFAANWLHALTAGALATMILAVMTRASLGHTGRPLQATRPVVAAYLLLTAAVVLRVFGTSSALPYAVAITGAASLWTLAFAIFVGVYAPILWNPRVDGRAG